MAKKIPEVDELVVGTVTRIFPHGAFVKIEGYDVEGMVHISEISPKWIKNITDFVQEGKKVVAKVLKIDHEKGHIDLSMKRISDSLKRDRMKQWKNEGRATKLMELCAKSLKGEKSLEEISDKLAEAFGSRFGAFEDAAANGTVNIVKAGVPKEWAAEIEKMAKTNIKVKRVTVAGYVELRSSAPNGVVLIKKALGTGSDIQYAGSPYYRIKVEDANYKNAEKRLKAVADGIIEKMSKSGGEGTFHRELKH
ncbi:MAG: translation initiation factor IF-2 subunit alpha [archaeon]